MVLPGLASKTLFFLCLKRTRKRVRIFLAGVYWRYFRMASGFCDRLIVRIWRGRTTFMSHQARFDDLICAPVTQSPARSGLLKMVSATLLCSKLMRLTLVRRRRRATKFFLKTSHHCMQQSASLLNWEMAARKTLLLELSTL